MCPDLTGLFLFMFYFGYPVNLLSGIVIVITFFFLRIYWKLGDD